MRSGSHARSGCVSQVRCQVARYIAGTGQVARPGCVSGGRVVLCVVWPGCVARCQVVRLQVVCQVSQVRPGVVCQVAGQVLCTGQVSGVRCHVRCVSVMRCVRSGVRCRVPRVACLCVCINFHQLSINFINPSTNPAPSFSPILSINFQSTFHQLNHNFINFNFSQLLNAFNFINFLILII
jgi:hypothetical protein